MNTLKTSEYYDKVRANERLVFKEVGCMEGRSALLGNHEFKEIESGLYCAAKPYEVNIEEWTYDKNHMGYQAITRDYETSPIATILYVSTTGTAGMKLISMYNEMKRKGENVGYIEGIPADSAMGEMYV